MQTAEWTPSKMNEEKNLKFGTTLGVTGPGTFINSIKLAEKTGFDYCWVPEIGLHEDIFIMLTLAALNTTKIKIGPCVTNPYVRNPGLVASAIATLGELSEWRVVLGLGVGGYGMLRPLGIKTWEKPLTAIREATEIIRRLLSEESVKYRGEVFQTEGARISFNVREKIPIYLGAFGIKMSQIAGEVADGVFISNLGKYTLIQIERIKYGARLASRDPSTLDIVLGTIFYASKEEDQAKDFAKKAIAELFIADPRLDLALKTNGMDLEEIYRARTVRSARVYTNMVTDEMVENFSVAGTPEQCIEKIAMLVKRYEPNQMRLLMYKIEDENLKKEMEMFKDKVLPAFR